MSGLIVLWMCVGVLRTLHWAFQPPGDVAHLVSVEPSPVAVHGIVVNDPAEFFSPNEPERQVGVIAIRHIHAHGSWQRAEGLIRARLLQSRVEVAYGDEVLLEGRWSSVPPPGNPGQYDWRAALARQRIRVLLTVEPSDGVVRLGRHPSWWTGLVIRVRHRLEGVIEGALAGLDAALIRSFILGQRALLPEDLKSAFVETGTMHLVVVSGFNVGLIGLMLEFALRLLGWPRRWRLAGTAAGLLGYCAITGMQPPVLRATLMAWTVLGAAWLDRVVNWPNTLAAAALAILCWNPMQLYDPGFQLSFGAVLSLSLLLDPAREILQPWMSRVAPGWPGRYLAIGLASTVAVWIGLWPLLAWYFHLISPISLVANLILVPLVSLLVSAGTSVLAAGLLLPSAVGMAAPLLERLVDLIVGAVRLLQQVPLGCWMVGHPSWMVILGYYALLALTLLAQPLRIRPVPLLAAWLLGVNGWIWSSVVGSLAESRRLEVTVLDVGHGDSLVIRTPQRQTIVIDAGSRQAGHYILAPFLRWHGWTRIDALVLTHFDEDHIGGAAALLQQGGVRRLLTNGATGRTQTARQLWRSARMRRIPHQPLEAGQRLTTGGNVAIMVLHPPAGFVPNTDSSSNENSVVLRMACGRTSFLFCGDLETQGLPWVLRWRSLLDSTVLKVPHHGSALGPSGEAFFRAVRPDLAVLSVGRRPGLPSEETRQSLSRLGARILETRRAGAVTIRTDGAQMRVRVFRDG